MSAAITIGPFSLDQMSLNEVVSPPFGSTIQLLPEYYRFDRSLNIHRAKARAADRAAWPDDYD
jgi:hypothetical protein